MDPSILAIASVGLLAAGSSSFDPPGGSMSKSLLSLPVPRPSTSIEIDNFFKKMMNSDRVYYVSGTKPTLGSSRSSRTSYAFPSQDTARSYVPYFESIGFSRVSLSSNKPHGFSGNKFFSWLTPSEDLASDIEITSSGLAGRILLNIYGVGHFDLSIVGNERDIRRIYTVNYLRFCKKLKMNATDTIDPFFHKISLETQPDKREELYRELHFLISKVMVIS